MDELSDLELVIVLAGYLKAGGLLGDATRTGLQSFLEDLEDDHETLEDPPQEDDDVE